MSYNRRSPSNMPTGPPNDILLRPGVDRIFNSLENRRRRLILLLLKRGMIDTEADVMVRGDSEAERVRTHLLHSDLPKLAESGYVEWDRETGGISRGPRFDEIEPLLELIEEHADELPTGWP